MDLLKEIKAQLDRVGLPEYLDTLAKAMEQVADEGGSPLWRQLAAKVKGLV